MHHIVSDGWSVGVLVKEVGMLYSAYKTARTDKSINLQDILPALPVQYVDYAAWQRNLLQGRLLDEQIAYWKKQLAGSQNLELITDRPGANPFNPGAAQASGLSCRRPCAQNWQRLGIKKA